MALEVEALRGQEPVPRFFATTEALQPGKSHEGLGQVNTNTTVIMLTRRDQAAAIRPETMLGTGSRVACAAGRHP